MRPAFSAQRRAGAASLRGRCRGPQSSDRAVPSYDTAHAYRALTSPTASSRSPCRTTRALRLNPNDTATCFNRAESFIKLRRWRRCGRPLCYIAAEDDDAEAFCRRGECRRAGNERAARMDLKRAAQHPDSAHGHACAVLEQMSCARGKASGYVPSRPTACPSPTAPEPPASGSAAWSLRTEPASKRPRAPRRPCFCRRLCRRSRRRRGLRPPRPAATGNARAHPPQPRSDPRPRARAWAQARRLCPRMRPRRTGLSGRRVRCSAATPDGAARSEAESAGRRRRARDRSQGRAPGSPTAPAAGIRTGPRGRILSPPRAPQPTCALGQRRRSAAGGIAPGSPTSFGRSRRCPWRSGRRSDVARADKDETSRAREERKLRFGRTWEKTVTSTPTVRDEGAARAAEAAGGSRGARPSLNPEFGTLDELIEKTTAPQTDSEAPPRARTVRAPTAALPPLPRRRRRGPRQGLPGSDEDGTDVSREDMVLEGGASLGRRRKRVMGGKPEAGVGGRDRTGFGPQDQVKLLNRPGTRTLGDPQSVRRRRSSWRSPPAVRQDVCAETEERDPWYLKKFNSQRCTKHWPRSNS